MIFATVRLGLGPYGIVWCWYPLVGTAGPWYWPGNGWALDGSGALAFIYYDFYVYVYFFDIHFDRRTNVFHCYLPISDHAGIGQT